ncbi:phage tail tip lysozyme [Pseudolactococcus yaeyamensis]
MFSDLAKKKAKKWLVGSVVGGLTSVGGLLMALLLIVTLITASGGASGSGNGCEIDDNVANADEINVVDPITSDWTQPNTKAYQNAKQIWDYWKDYGLNGHSISGILGNIAHEGGFAIVDRAQGHMGNDEATNGIAAGVDPIADKEENIGAGVYQFTHYSKFAPKGDPKWLDLKAQNDFVWASEFKSARWRDDYFNESDTAQATKDWFTFYERGAAFDAAKLASAQKAYDLFNGSSVTADRSKFDAKIASSNGAPSTGSGDNSSVGDEDSECGKNSGNVTGDYGIASDAIPEEYASKISVLPDTKNYEGNTYEQPQCTWGAYNRLSQLGKPVVVLYPGNGGQWGDTAKGLGYHVQTGGTPKAGYAASFPPGLAGSDSTYGHIAVVEYVNDDGSILISETNVKGAQRTWRVLSKSIADQIIYIDFAQKG